MTDQTFTRRQFLQGTTRIGLTLTLAAVPGSSPRPAHAQKTPQILVSHGTGILSDHDVQNWFVSGLGGCGLQANFSTRLLAIWSLTTRRRT